MSLDVSLFDFRGGWDFYVRMFKWRVRYRGCFICIEKAIERVGEA